MFKKEEVKRLYDETLQLADQWLHAAEAQRCSNNYTEGALKIVLTAQAVLASVLKEIHTSGETPRILPEYFQLRSVLRHPLSEWIEASGTAFKSKLSTEQLAQHLLGVAAQRSESLYDAVVALGGAHAFLVTVILGTQSLPSLSKLERDTAAMAIAVEGCPVAQSMLKMKSGQQN